MHATAMVVVLLELELVWASKPDVVVGSCVGNDSSTFNTQVTSGIAKPAKGFKA